MTEPEYVIVQPGLDGVAWLGEVIDGELSPVGNVSALLASAARVVQVEAELAEAERDYERATELADARFASANLLHAKWQDAERDRDTLVEKVRALADEWMCPVDHTSLSRPCVYCCGASLSRATVVERLRALVFETLDWMFACDVPGCSIRYAAHEELRGGGEAARLEARRRANAEGWRCTETTDLCPQHNSVKVPTETCWRGECRTGCYYPETCTDGFATGDADPTCSHDWLLRPESDTRECLICGDER
jgi:hypothetical protein